MAIKITKILWDMPITIEITEANAGKSIVDQIFAYFSDIDQVFSTFRPDSEISRINRGEIKEKNWSREMRKVMTICNRAKKGHWGLL